MVDLDNIRERNTKVAVIGLGYVGLPLAVAIAEAGYPTTGVDADRGFIDELKKPSGSINGIGADQLERVTGEANFNLSSDYSPVAESEITLITVPTPLNKFREPDMSYVKSSMRGLAPHINPGQLIIVESTLYPRATEDEIAPLLQEESGLVPGEDFHLVFSPERIDPGNKSYELKDVPKVVGGMTRLGSELAEEFYRNVLDADVHVVSSPRVAEMEKLLENVYRNVNIALVNEMNSVCEELDIDIWETIDAASTKPYGFQPFYPGPGVGGHCIPVDPFFVSWKAREKNTEARFIELAGQINRNRPKYVVERLAEVLNEREKSVKGSKILVLGAAYKKDIGDVRNSPGLEIIRILEERGAEVNYNDPYVDRVRTKGRKFLNSVGLEGVLLNEADCVLIVTDHSDYDYEWLVEEANLVLDTRNATAEVETGEGKVVKL